MALNAQTFATWRTSAVAALTAAGFTPANAQAAVDAAEVEAIKQVLLSQSPDLIAAINQALSPVVQAAKQALAGP